ncbi:MAG: GGDEF domain-containing protein [Alkalispirochaetaceae bacterium]
MKESSKRVILLFLLTLCLTALLFLLADPRPEDPGITDTVADTIIFILPSVWLVLLGASTVERDTRIVLDVAFLLLYLAAFFDLADNVVLLSPRMEAIRGVARTVGMVAVTVGLGRWIRRQDEILEQLREQEERLVTLSITDELTGLYNSRYFFRCLDQEIERSERYQRPISMIFMDIDNFKRFNDQHGHVEGDKVIRELGRSVSSLLRGNDMAFRYGGEEFVVLLPETVEGEAALVAERIREGFSKITFRPADGSGPLHTTISLGVAQLEKGEKPKDFLRRADQALYQSKSSGKNTVFQYSRFRG